MAIAFFTLFGGDGKRIKDILSVGHPTRIRQGGQASNLGLYSDGIWELSCEIGVSCCRVNVILCIKELIGACQLLVACLRRQRLAQKRQLCFGFLCGVGSGGVKICPAIILDRFGLGILRFVGFCCQEQCVCVILFAQL